jgi:peptidoglycan/xylan/chitin deacetylase (PgdA/CDA1 family)
MARIAAGVAWRVPGRFGVARILGRGYSLRSIVFHDISNTESPFTKGMGVSHSPARIEQVLRHICRHYRPVSLEQVLADRDGRALPERAILVTFDDGYASLMETAVPLCRQWGIPAVFFLNASVLDNRRLAADNVVCYAVNRCGMEAINGAARAVKGDGAPRLHGLAEVFSRLFPVLSVSERQTFLDLLIEKTGESESELARAAGLYFTSKQVGELAAAGFEIGNHTYTHVRCRSLTIAELEDEIDRNRKELETISGASVRCFSVPYGSSADLTADLSAHLRRTGHRAVFLSESVANVRQADRCRLDRVSPSAETGQNEGVI